MNNDDDDDDGDGDDDDDDDEKRRWREKLPAQWLAGPSLSTVS